MPGTGYCLLGDVEDDDPDQPDHHERDHDRRVPRGLGLGTAGAAGVVVAGVAGFLRRRDSGTTAPRCMGPGPSAGRRVPGYGDEQAARRVTMSRMTEASGAGPAEEPGRGPDGGRPPVCPAASTLLSRLRQGPGAGVAVVLGAAGLLFVASGSTAQGTDLRDDSADLASLVGRRAQPCRPVELRGGLLRGRSRRWRQVPGVSDPALAAAVEEMSAAAGMQAVRGPAVRVVLDDADFPAQPRGPGGLARRPGRAPAGRAGRRQRAVAGRGRGDAAHGPAASSPPARSAASATRSACRASRTRRPTSSPPSGTPTPCWPPSPRPSGVRT